MRVLIIVPALLLTACATSPASIQPKDVDHRQYLALSCDELAERIKTTDADYRDHVDGQGTQQKYDLLVFPGFSKVTGIDGRNVKAIETLGGELLALRRAQAEKQCGNPTT
jgi:hypothetical protein